MNVVNIDVEENGLQEVSHDDKLYKYLRSQGTADEWITSVTSGSRGEVGWRLFF